MFVIDITDQFMQKYNFIKNYIFTYADVSVKLKCPLLRTKATKNRVLIL
jgi:hypothetical protein